MNVLDEIADQNQPYSSREIREKWHDSTQSLQRIESKVDKTNGSVADINRWRERINGGAIVAGVFMTIIVMPILCWAIYELVQLPEIINNSVNKALSAYDLTIK